jgi:hypothetical protein
MTIFNDSASTSITIQSIQIYWNTQGNQTLLGAVNLNGQQLWTGSNGSSPSLITTFLADIIVLPNSSELLQLSFNKPYNTNGTERIIITFEETSCPQLDSSNASQLK